MIQNTFCHFPGITLATERQLWDQGVTSWDDLLGASCSPITPRKKEALKPLVALSREHLQKADPAFFAQLLNSRDHWRLFRHFRPATAYLDIETTGLGNPGDHITTIALYDGQHIHHYIHGQNLDAFAHDIQRYALLITFNGKCFDLPFIERTLGIRLSQAHIDLRYVLKALGYAGGLKAIEKRFGMDRDELDGVDGFLAVLLWRDYRRRKDPQALETLLAYNVQDVLNLEILMVQAFNLMLQETPFLQSHTLELGCPLANPFHAHRPIIERCLRQNPW